jgi:hypothetical protein
VIGRSTFRYRRGSERAANAAFLNEEDERRGAAVHDRHFRRVQLDDRVVDAGADQRREHMFDGLDTGIAQTQLRGVGHGAQVVDRRRNFHAPEVRPPEANP